MSLINDALKRASQIQPTPSPNAEPETPLRAVEYTRHPSLPRLFLPVTLLLVLGLAGWFFLKSWQSGHTPNLPAYKMPVQARELPPEPAKITPQQTAAIPAPALEKSSAPAVAAPPTNVVEPPKPTFPPVRLQGFFYRARNPSVMINSKTVVVGDKLGSIKVVAITRDGVTLEWHGETKVLTLDE
jgi:hypothetical protein